MTEASVVPVLRFAPSPNGLLHLGHAYSALRNDQLARRVGGRLLLRMEDIDRERCKPEFEQAILADLEWLGLHWESPVRRQSDHFDTYSAALDRLDAKGLLYPCFCTRSDIAKATNGRRDWPQDPDLVPLYPGTCRHLSAAERVRRLASGQSAALRLDSKAAIAAAGGALTWREFGEFREAREIAAEPERWGDAIVGRRDVPASYHIACVVDDALQGVTDVVRGQDLFNATSLHRLLQTLLGLPAPNYHHHALLRDAAGMKLSKSAKAKSLRECRREGATPEQIRRDLGFA